MRVEVVASFVRVCLFAATIADVLRIECCKNKTVLMRDGEIGSRYSDGSEIGTIGNTASRERK